MRGDFVQFARADFLIYRAWLPLLWHSDHVEKRYVRKRSHISSFLSVHTYSRQGVEHLSMAAPSEKAAQRSSSRAPTIWLDISLSGLQKTAEQPLAQFIFPLERYAVVGESPHGRGPDLTVGMRYKPDKIRAHVIAVDKVTMRQINDRAGQFRSVQ